MNRVIKIRAWDTVLKEMHYWTLEEIWQSELMPDFKEYEIMLWTGLLDKHRKEIFEGDIVQSVLHHFKGVVYFERGSFWVQELFTHVDEGVYDGDMQKETVWSIGLAYKVIGNVYENPELLT